MLSIKEAYRYSNFLSDIKEEIKNEFLYNMDYYMKTKEIHSKSKACIGAEDETIEGREKVTYNIDNIKVTGVAKIIELLVNEKLRLAIAIEEGKKNLEIDWEESGEKITLDSAVEYNKNLRELANSFMYNMITKKSEEIKGTGTDYTFNQEGNQVPYKYNIDIIKTINYDRNYAKSQYKKLLSKTDKISTLIESAMLKEVVDFEPRYDIHDRMEDILVMGS